jgi:hypothetical protein
VRADERLKELLEKDKRDKKACTCLLPHTSCPVLARILLSLLGSTRFICRLPLFFLRTLDPAVRLLFQAPAWMAFAGREYFLQMSFKFPSWPVVARLSLKGSCTEVDIRQGSNPCRAIRFDTG